ncbi:2-hydroxyacid dehydrogenase [Oceanobacillus chungangensis]|uniref:D-glycerate dehydrogenase n=1 Tax=Oceanobacillus chungangensis TaxID=1229152 RepID=A0A3D8PYA5_9BACI|nr:D-glycerate dehydrogenase [Oceanobacillus chungangensis]RDW21004.1 D-glycerate dehydrogenase [Oceanobacillus chungangensis]
MEKKRIYITRKLNEAVLAPYADLFEIRMWGKEEEPVPRDILLKEVKDIDGLFCMLSDKIDEELLQHAHNLKVVSNLAVGYDNIDLEAASEHGVIATNTPDVLTETTADLGFALLMATARRIVEANHYIKTNKWQNWAPFLLAGADIHHKTIGIVGMGRIGEAIARRAKGFGMNILYHNRSRKPAAEEELQATYVSFEQLIGEADFIVSVVPFTPETNKIFNKAAFEKMKQTAIFINISRGATVDEDALVEAIRTKTIKAAGLDVFEVEPITSDHPLMQLDNVVCIPHIGSASEETRTEMIRLCMDNIAGVLSGTGAKTAIR